MAQDNSKKEQKTVRPPKRKPGRPSDDVRLPRKEFEAIIANQDRMQAELDTLRHEREAQSIGLRTIDDIGAPKTESAVKEFLEAERPPTEIFAQQHRFTVMLIHPRRAWNAELNREEMVPGLYLKFLQWRGIGSELRDPQNPKKQVFPWGRADLAALDGVVQGHYSVDQAVAAVKQSKLFQEGAIFFADTAKVFLKTEYDSRRAYTEAQKIRQEHINQVTTQVAKAGRLLADANNPEPSPAADAQQAAVAGVM